MEPGAVGLVLSYALTLIGMFQWGVRQSTEVENMVGSLLARYTAPPPCISRDVRVIWSLPFRGAYVTLLASFFFCPRLEAILIQIRLICKEGECVNGNAGRGDMMLTMIPRFNGSAQCLVFTHSWGVSFLLHTLLSRFTMCVCVCVCVCVCL